MFRCRIIEDFTGGKRLYLIDDQIMRGGKVNVINGWTSIEHNEGEGDAFLSADGIANAGELLQCVLDEAWENGMRPSGFSDVKNEIAALRGHLEDMRAITFHELGMK